VPQATDDAERDFLDIIERHHWHVMLVSADEEGPGFAYSTGIYRLTGMPELIVFGLARDVAHFVVNEYGNRVRAGENLSPGEFYDDFLEGHPVTFIQTDSPDRDREYTTWTSWFYDRKPFPVLQLVYPDSRSGAFPWQPGYREEWRDLQPLLGSPPALQ
jgi:hypothetical protein